MAGKSPKTDPIEMDRRVGVVIDLCLAGLTAREIHRHIREVHADWNIGDRQRRLLLDRARKEIAKASEPRRELEVGRALMRYDVLYRRSFDINDYKTCAQLVKQTTDLLGLAAPQRHEHTGPDGGPIQHGHESKTLPELEAEIRRLLGGPTPGGQEPVVQPADCLPPGFGGTV